MSNISLFGFYCDLIYLQMIFLKNIEWLIWTELNWSSRTWPNLALAKPGLTLSISPRSLSLKRTARTRFPSPYASSDVVATLWFRSVAGRLRRRSSPSRLLRPLILLLHQILLDATPLSPAPLPQTNPSCLQFQPSPADSGVAVRRRDSSINSPLYLLHGAASLHPLAPLRLTLVWPGSVAGVMPHAGAPSGLLPLPRRRRDGTAGLQPRRPCTGAGDAAMSALVVLWLRWCCCWWHGDGALLLLLPPRPWRRRDGAADATPASTSTSSAAIAMWAISHSSLTLSMALC
jgi:hypothetical protein